MSGFFGHPLRCAHCGYFFERETGYFLPSVVVGYIVTVLLGLAVWPIAEIGFGIHSDAVLLSLMLTTVVVFALWFVRYAKMIWMAVDLLIQPPRREDFEARGRTRA